MGKIVLLDDLTINQIAAGEVIERPASVVKELVENSIDAKAKNVTVEIKNGGISYIKVTDDGTGIMPDDMEIAFERHATSKIRQAKDLDSVKSMGFRGEALASIAAIAKVELVSKTADSDLGYVVYAEGGNVTDKHESGAQKGTQITVKELFYNTPVRYKFLKKDFTESGYIEDTITRIALANPGVAIKLINTGKTVIQTNGSGKIEDVVYAIYGKEIYDNILPVDYTYEDYHVTGVIGKPIISRSNRSNQLFFVNNRYIKDPTLTSAAEQGFKGLVTIGKHGFLILNIDMNPSKVDVNVHPTKLEVRFQEESKVFKAIYHAIKETLLKSDLVSDPVKDYSDVSQGDIGKVIKNKDRVQAWSLNKENITSNNEIKHDEQKQYSSPLNDSKGSLDETKILQTPMQNESTNGNSDFAGKIAGNSVSSTIGNVANSSTVNNIANKTISGIADNTKKIDETLSETDKLINKINSKMAEIFDDSKDEKSKEDTTKEVNKLLDEVIKKDQKSNDSQDKERLQDENIGNSQVNSGNSEQLSDKNGENVETPSLGDVEFQTENLVKLNNPNSEQNFSDNELNKINNDNIFNEVDQKLNELATQKEEKESELTFEEKYKKIFGRDIAEAQAEYKAKLAQEDAKYETEPITDNEISLFKGEEGQKNPPYNFVGIAFKTYIILTINDELYILDQHAAHERIMYEKVKANYYNDEQKDSQMMLLPDVIELSNKEMGMFRDDKELFNKAGFIVEEFGENAVKLTGVPEFCLDFDTKEIFLETLDEIDTVARTAKQEREDKFLATIACKAAVKAHMALTKEEVDSLMEQLLKLPNPFSCPHGRPTVIKMSKTDIEKKFSRRQ